MLLAKDPVCGMDVDEKKSKIKTTYDGKAYYFCSEFCRKKFEKDPNKFIKQPFTLETQSLDSFQFVHDL